MDKFIEQLQNYKEQPSPQLWDRIEDRLALQTVSKSRRRYRIAAFTSVIAIAILLGFMFLPENSVDKDMFVSIGNDKAQIVDELSISDTPDDIFSTRNRKLVDYAYAKLAKNISF